jgi:hypothetical protein
VNADEEIAALKARITRLEAEQKQERDRMIGATFHALSTVISQWDTFGYGEALKWAQSQSQLPKGYRANGTYGTMRAEIRDMLIRLDLLHPQTLRFKSHGES